MAQCVVFPSLYFSPSSYSKTQNLEVLVLNKSKTGFTKLQVKEVSGKQFFLCHKLSLKLFFHLVPILNPKFLTAGIWIVLNYFQEYFGDSVNWHVYFKFLKRNFKEMTLCFNPSEILAQINSTTLTLHEI